MKTIVIAVFLGLIINLTAFGQNNQFSKSCDTLTFYRHTGGTIDTFDLTYSFPLSTIPGGGFNAYNAVPTIDFFRKSPYLFTKTLPQFSENWKFSALPHIGFFYSFGTKGTQFLHADYQQKFRNQSLLNLSIDRSSSSKEKAMVRNGGFAHQDFKAAYRFGMKRINGELHGIYQQNTMSLNAGIRNDSSILTNGLNFAPVNKANANSLQQFVNLRGELKMNLLPDSAFIRAGITTQHQYSVWNRVYNESSDTLSLIYDAIYLDSTTTRDQFQDAKLKNAIGLFAENKRFTTSFTVSHRYWRFQNLASNRDTNEISTEFKLALKLKRIDVKSENYFNVLGAKNEFSSKSSAKWGRANKFLAGSFVLESMLPDLTQRFYFGNNLSYQSGLDKQTRMDINLTGSYSIWKIEALLSVGSLAWKNNLVWDNSAWVQGSQSNLTANYIKTNLHFDFNWFQMYTDLQLNYGNQFLPKAILSSRLMVKKKVFAAKKLHLSFALDPQLTDQYKFMSYNTLLDNWYFDSSNRVGRQKISLHSTFTLHIEEFKFFIRTENLQAFWTAKNTEIAQDYYRPSFLLRLGISWDFFN